MGEPTNLPPLQEPVPAAASTPARATATEQLLKLLGDTTAERLQKLKPAAAEILLAGALLLSDVQRENSGWNSASQAKASETRFRAALEQLREAMS